MSLTATVGYTVVSASNLRDSTGTSIANATIYFSPVDNKGNPLSYRTGGVSPGATSDNAVSVVVTNGAFQILLADPNLTLPVNIGYAVTVIDNVTGNSLLGPGYGCVQWPTGLAFDFDTYQPNLAAQTTVQYGPPGQAATVAVGTVSEGGAAAVTNTGTSNAAVLNFTLPQGPQGQAATVAVGTVSEGGSAAVTNTGTSGAAVLNFTLPQGPTGPPGSSSIGFPVYATTAAGVAVGTGAAVGGFFAIAATNADHAYDMYQNVAGVATFVQSLPSALISAASSVADLLTIRDQGGFEYPLGAMMQTLLTEGITVFATPASAIANNIALNSYFFTPSTVTDAIFELYQNVADVPVHQGTLQNQVIHSDNVHPISISDESGFRVDILNSDGTDPRFQPAFNANMLTRDLNAAIVMLNQQCMSYSRAISKSFNISLATAEYLYNYMIWYGQSLSTGFDTVAFESAIAKYGNLMVGTTVTKNSANQNPSTNTLFNPLVEQSTGTSGETECSGMANTAKAMINRYLMTTNAANKLFVANSLGQPGVPISELIPTASVPPPGTTYTGNLFSPIPTFMAAAAVDAASSASPGGAGSIGLTGFFYCQGENDDDDIATDPTYSTYMANLDAIRAAVNAQAVTSFSQVREAGLYTYQTGGEYTSDAGGLAIQNCQWIMALNRPNFFLFGPHSQYPDLGGHLTSNSYRWLGSMAGKVWFLTAVLRQGWQPLSPHKVTIVNSQTLLVGFHVPVPPLTIGTAYNVAAPVNYPDLGFNLFDAVGFIPITVSIVADQVVQINASRIVDWTTSYLRYADTGASSPTQQSTLHNGCGNLTDSDTTVADDIYVASANQNGTPDGTQYDIAGLVGNPYPLNNWCIAFQLHPNTFNSTGPVIG
jgi:hypothetical protein